MINSGNIDTRQSTRRWNPKDVFDRYVQSLRDGEINLTRSAREGNAIVTRTYFYGGVDLMQIPIDTVTDAAVTAREPEATQRLVAALADSGGTSPRGDVWRGGVYLAGGGTGDYGWSATSGCGLTDGFLFAPNSTQKSDADCTSLTGSVQPPPPTATATAAATAQPVTTAPVTATTTATATAVVSPTPTATPQVRSTVGSKPIQVTNGTGDSLTVTVSGPVQDSWTVANGQKVDHPVPFGTYQISVQASCGTQTDTVSVTATQWPTLTFSCSAR
jgi:hypothetical protein